MEDTNLAKKSKAELIALVEDLTTRLDGNKTIVVNLQAENDELKKKLAAATAAAEKSDKKLKAASSTVITDSTKALTAEVAAERKSNAALREIIEMSCQDHCPHHRNEGACQNCEIRKRLNAVGGARKE